MHAKGVPTTRTTSRSPTATPGSSGRCTCPITPADPPKVAGSNRPPAYVNENSHWWDGSQVYGSTTAEQAMLRAGTRRQDAGAGPTAGSDSTTSDRREITGFTENRGSASACCTPVRARAQRHLRPPQAGTSRLGRRTAVPAGAPGQRGADGQDPHRRVDAGDPAAPVISARSTPTGTGSSATCRRCFADINDNELLGGIPGSPTDHHTAPYSLTEEFVSVYRMHSLMPDDFTIRSVSNDAVLGQFDAAGHVGPGGAEGARAVRLRRSVLFVRRRASGRAAAAQLPEAPAERCVNDRRASASTSQPSTSCAIASAACRATTGSGACCTSRR